MVTAFLTCRQMVFGREYLQILAIPHCQRYSSPSVIRCHNKCEGMTTFFIPARQVVDVKVHMAHVHQVPFLVDVTHSHLDIWVIEISPGVLSCHDYEVSVGLFKSNASGASVLHIHTHFCFVCYFI